MRFLAMSGLACLSVLAATYPSYGQETEATAVVEARARDIPGNTTTKTALRPGQSFYGSLETVGDNDWLKMRLKAGSYQVRLHGVGVRELKDPVLSLYDGAGASLGSIDDSPSTSWGGANGLDPYAILTIAAEGIYYLGVSSAVQGSTDDDVGDYLVTLVEGDSSAGLVMTPDEIAWQLTNNFREWTGYNSAIALKLGRNRQLTYNVSKLTTLGKRLAEAALASWSDVTGITFKRTSGAAQLDFDNSDAGVNAYTSPTVSGDGSTILSSRIMITKGWLDRFGTSLDSYSFETYLHETGEALGLGHAGNYDGSTGDQYYKNDSVAYSVMSFSQAANDEFTQGGPANNPNVDASFRYMLTMGVADIIAIQNLYGTTSRTRTGDTTYGFNSNAGDAALDLAATLGADMFMCVYDDGGTDTLDFSRTRTAQLIDLNAESFSNVLGGRMNLSIARGVVIEDAVGGSGRDTLIGNAAANRLTGGDGKDTFVFSSELGAVDRIEDFSPADDMIALSRSVFAKLAKGGLPANAFKDLGVAGAKVDASDRIIYDRRTGALSYDPDGDGDSPAVRFATLRNTARLTAANIRVN